MNLFLCFLICSTFAAKKTGTEKAIQNMIQNFLKEILKDTEITIAALPECDYKGSEEIWHEFMRKEVLKKAANGLGKIEKFTDSDFKSFLTKGLCVLFAAGGRVPHMETEKLDSLAEVIFAENVVKDLVREMKRIVKRMKKKHQ